jgi:hypothetical protein
MPSAYQSDARAFSVSKCGRTTQHLGIILESQMMGVTVNVLELVGKLEEYQTLGNGMIMSDQGVSLRVLKVTKLR